MSSDLGSALSESLGHVMVSLSATSRRSEKNHDPSRAHRCTPLKVFTMLSFAIKLRMTE